ncbi:MAG: c-type cytochrome [Propylenella sp.]
MSVWKRFGFLCFAAAATLVAGGFGVALEAGLESSSPKPPAGIQLAQAKPKLMEAPETTPADLERVSPEVGAEEPPAFSEEFLKDAKNVEMGKVVWETCAGCHGARAYPGKAPKLRPRRYTPEFVFHQATFGSKNGKMPPFGDAFTRDERMAVVSWVLSKQFTP